MKSLFPGHYRPSEKEFTDMWENALFVLDTSVLLDLYRYSDETVKTLLSVIESLKDRIWIPYHVSKEYHQNLTSIISSQVKKYQDTIKTLTDFKSQIEEKRNHPFLSSELHEEINVFCNKFETELDNKKELVTSLILDNPIKEKLAQLLKDNIGDPIPENELKELYKEGSERYKKKIPPGYMDSTSKPGNEKFGDFIIWKEILKKNSEIESPLILVTGDRKEDWFLKEMGLTVGPRPELIEEFLAIKNNSYYCYSTDSFLQYVKEYFEIEINDKILEEVGEFIKQQPTSNEAIKESYSSSESHDPSLTYDSESKSTLNPQTTSTEQDLDTKSENDRNE